MKILTRFKRLVTILQPQIYKGWIFLWLFVAASGFSQIYISEGTQISFSGEVELVGEVISQSAKGSSAVFADEGTLIVGLDKIEPGDSEGEQISIPQPSKHLAQTLTTPKTEEQIQPVSKPAEPEKEFTSLPSENSLIAGSASGILAAQIPQTKSVSAIEFIPFQQHVVADQVRTVTGMPETFESDYKMGYTNRPPPTLI